MSASKDGAVPLEGVTVGDAAGPSRIGQEVIPFTREFIVDRTYGARAGWALGMYVTIRGGNLLVGAIGVLIGLVILLAEGLDSIWWVMVLIGAFVVFALPLLLVAGGLVNQRSAPAGTRFRSGFGAERFAVEGPLISSTVAYTMYRRAVRHGDFVFLRQRANKQWGAWPGELFGDEDLARFPQN